MATGFQGRHWRRGSLEKDYLQALRLLRAAVERGHSTAKRDLSAWAYGGAPDPSWTLCVEIGSMGLAPPQGDTSDFVLLSEWESNCYTLSQKATKEQVQEAESRWREAAERGVARAQFNLGSMYYCGKGVPEDRTAAAMWYRRAAHQGHGRAQLILGVILVNVLLNGEERSIHKMKKTPLWQEAALWLRTAHAQGFGPVWMYFEFMDEAPELQPGRPEFL